VHEDEVDGLVIYQSCVNCYKHDKCPGFIINCRVKVSCWGPRETVFVWDHERVV
jgi:hypothetical protein